MICFSRNVQILGIGCSLMMFVGCTTIQPKWSFPKLLSKSVASKPSAPKPVVEVTPKIDAKQSQIDLLMAIAENHESHSNLVAAAKAYEEALKKGKSQEASHRLAIVKFKLGDREKTWELLDRCLKQSPKDVELLADVGYLRHLNGDVEEAEKMTRRGLAIDSESARLHNNLGLILVDLDRADEAFEEFSLAGCSESEAYSNLGHAYVASKQLEKGEHYLKLAATSPQPCTKAAATLDHLLARGHSLAAK